MSEQSKSIMQRTKYLGRCQNSLRHHPTNNIYSSTLYYAGLLLYQKGVKRTIKDEVHKRHRVNNDSVTQFILGDCPTVIASFPTMATDMLMKGPP